MLFAFFFRFSCDHPVVSFFLYAVVFVLLLRLFFFSFFSNQLTPGPSVWINTAFVFTRLQSCFYLIVSKTYFVCMFFTDIALQKKKTQKLQ